MFYTVQKLAEMAGVSSRTIRYYDQIDLLKPAEINHSGYRLYGPTEVNRLQEILFYRALGLSLKDIKKALDKPTQNRLTILDHQLNTLLDKKLALDALIDSVEKSIQAEKGRYTMTDKEKFQGLKQQKIDKNEKLYGKEIRSAYGDQAIDDSNRQLLNLSEESYAQMEDTESELIKLLCQAYETNDTSDEIAERITTLHKKWLMFHWTTYKKEDHLGLASMYLADERFTAYYDKFQSGLTAFFVERLKQHLEA